MRTIDRIIVHCTASPEGRADTLADITQWHIEDGYNTIGYHFLIGIKGETWTGRKLEIPGAHALGYNQHSIGICYVGGLTVDKKHPKDTRTPEQKASLLVLLRDLKERFPNAVIIGHCDVSNKDCPCFNSVDEYKDL